jgi:hypothetical protein
MVGMNDKMFLLKRLCFHVKGENSDLSVEGHVRKTRPWRNKIKQMLKQNTEDTQYNRDTDLRGSPSERNPQLAVAEWKRQLGRNIM